MGWDSQRRLLNFHLCWFPKKAPASVQDIWGKWFGFMTSGGFFWEPTYMDVYSWCPGLSPENNSCGCFLVTWKYTINMSGIWKSNIQGLETFCQQQPKHKSITLESLRPEHKNPRRTGNCEPHCATFGKNSSNLIGLMVFKHEEWWVTQGPHQLETDQKTDRP